MKAEARKHFVNYLDAPDSEHFENAGLEISDCLNGALETLQEYLKSETTGYRPDKRELLEDYPGLIGSLVIGTALRYNASLDNQVAQEAAILQTAVLKEEISGLTAAMRELAGCLTGNGAKS